MAEAAFPKSLYTTVERGIPNSTEYRLFLKDQNGPISPMHDIPLYVDPEAEKKVYNAVVLAPKWSNGKFQLAVNKSLNPIHQETRKGELRYVVDCCLHRGYIWNYCVLTQTWRTSSELIDKRIGTKGDNYLVELLEIGFRVATRGTVLQVKILGCIAWTGQTGWRIIGIDIKDPMAAKVHDLSDVVKQYPGLLRTTLEWYNLISIQEGKQDYRGSCGEVHGTAYAQNIVLQYNKFWKRLVMNEVNPWSVLCLNTTIIESPYRIHSSDAEVIIEQP